MPQSKAKSKSEHALIYVLSGKDEALVVAEARKLLDELIAPEQRVTGLLDVEGPGVSPADVLDELRTLPFLAERRVVLVRKADEFISKDDNRRILERYFDAPCSTGILVLLVRSWPSNTKLARKLKHAGVLISITEPKAYELPRRMIEYAAQAHRMKLDSQAAGLLIDLTGNDLPRLYGEIDKLALFAQGAETITSEHIAGLIGHSRIFGAFEVIDAIITGSPAAALDRLRRMFADDSSSEYTVVGAFAFHLRRMFQAKVLLDKGAPIKQIADSLRIWSNRDGFFTQVSRMSVRQIGRCLKRLGRTDYAIKTGRTTAPVAMEQLVLELAAVAQ
ncbi:MAG: DNA polymerase III subunit delta [Sedimentisphaerales bacterium]|nr:DNA polymerase III subunit delta [Sedimentisphaerales bacterium]